MWWIIGGLAVLTFGVAGWVAWYVPRLLNGTEQERIEREKREEAMRMLDAERAYRASRYDD